MKHDAQRTGPAARITEPELEALRARIGKDIHLPQPHIEEATKDAIRHWAHGIGDTNPLWCDEHYARQTPYGDLLAPPTFLYAADRIVSGYVGGLPGVHAMFAGTDWEWHRVIRRGTTFKVSAQLKELVEHRGRFSGRAIQQIYRVDFRDQDGDLIASADSWCFRTERDTARELGKYGVIEPHVFSREELAEISDAYARERPRGSEPRYWEDVVVGDALPDLLKGPYTPTTAVTFDQGWGGLYLAGHRVAYDMFRRHPALGIPNEFGVPEPPERVHWDGEMARAVGVPDAYDYGPERVSWLGHVATDWMGDAGQLRRLRIEVRRHNLVGDLTTCSGRVAAKELDGERGIVTCQLSAANHRGERIAEGTATIELPRAPRPAAG
jgi:acyl dehydratase